MSSRASIAVHALHVVHAEPALVIGELGPVCIVVWRGEVTATRFMLQKNALVDVASRYRPLGALLCIIEENAPPPPNELRKASVEMLAALEADLCCVANVIEGSGFKGALTRSVLLGMTVLLGQRSFPMTFVATVDEAATWMAQYLSIPPKSFRRDVEELRAEGLAKAGSSRRAGP